MQDILLWFNPFVGKAHESSLLTGFVFLAMIVCPVFIYLLIGWPWKRNEIFAMLNSEDKDRYLNIFQKQNSDIITAKDRFESFYNKWYGRKFYIVPILLVGVAAVYLGILLGETGMYYLQKEQDGVPAPDFTRLPLIAAAAVAGAFTFVAWDLITGAARRSMFWNDVLLGALRLVICVPVGYAMSAYLPNAVGSFIAFAMGVVPVDVLATILRRILNKYGLRMGADTAHDQIVKLSGIDATVADRIYGADITTIAQLAYCDPIQLAMRTNLSFVYLLDGVSQAQAWLYLEEKLDRIRSMGLRGAYELKTLSDDMAQPDADSEKLAAQAATALQLTPEQFHNVLRQIAGDPYTQFMYGVFS